MLHGLQDKFNSLHENKYFKILECEWESLDCALPTWKGSRKAAATPSASLLG